MHYVYFLKSVSQNWYYVGSTSDLKARLYEHMSGAVRSTKPKRPLELVYYEAYKELSIARAREKCIKSKRIEKEAIISRIKNHGPIV